MHHATLATKRGCLVSGGADTKLVLPRQMLDLSSGHPMPVRGPVKMVFGRQTLVMSVFNAISHFLMKSIKRELYPVGRPELVKNSKHIVPHCIFA